MGHANKNQCEWSFGEKSYSDHLSSLTMLSFHSTNTKMKACYKLTKDNSLTDTSAMCGYNVHLGAHLKVGKEVVIGNDSLLNDNSQIGDFTMVGEGGKGSVRTNIRKGVCVEDNIILRFIREVPEGNMARNGGVKESFSFGLNLSRGFKYVLKGGQCELPKI